jgi:ATP-dependent DNA ligase
MFLRQEIEPGACDGGCPNPAITGVPIYVLAEEKLDGHRALLHLHRSFDRAYLTSRRISKKTGRYAENGLNVPHIIAPAADSIRFLNCDYTVLDGELIVPSYLLEDVQSVTGSSSHVAIAWQKDNKPAVLRVFDILFMNGVDVRHKPLRYRKSLVSEAIESIGSRFIQKVDFKLVESPEEIKFLYESILSGGGEGLVLKNPDSPYGKCWTKMKKTDTYDVVVVGYKKSEPDGKFREMIGAVRFGVYENGKLVEVGRCSGMKDGNVDWVTDYGAAGSPNREGSWVVPISDDQPAGSRAWFTMNRDKLLGTVIEVEGNGLTKHGKIHHPRFVRLRPDKAPQMCQSLKE